MSNFRKRRHDFILFGLSTIASHYNVAQVYGPTKYVVIRRYKMVSQFTWPNFHGADPEEGTRVLLEDRKLVKDVTFGKTKLFVRSPSTLFELEKLR